MSADTIINPRPCVLLQHVWGGTTCSAKLSWGARYRMGYVFFFQYLILKFYRSWVMDRATRLLSFVLQIKLSQHLILSFLVLLHLSKWRTLQFESPNESRTKSILVDWCRTINRTIPVSHGPNPSINVLWSFLFVLHYKLLCSPAVRALACLCHCLFITHYTAVLHCTNGLIDSL